MAENIISTRIKLPYDTLENWNSSQGILKQGEIAIVEIPAENNTEGMTPPAIAIKVGDGSKTFSQLEYIQAIAGDVHAWAKTANLKDATLTGYTKTAADGSIAPTDTLQAALSKLENEIAQISGDVGSIDDENTTYVFATGATDGTISVTPSEGEPYEVALKGFDQTFTHCTYANNTLTFSHGSGGSALATIDLPAEQFIDTTRTTFVNNFAWSDTTYPDSTDPNLEGKPVLVLALHEEGEANPTYSFLNMEYLVDIYTGGSTGTATVNVNGQEITVDVKVSAEANNMIVAKADGMFATAQSSDGTVNVSTAGGVTDITIDSISTDLLAQGVDTLILDCGGAIE